MVTQIAQLKALLSTVIFVIAGIFSWFYFPADQGVSVPAFFLYIMLVIHAYFSVRIFASITPPAMISQNIIDIILLVLYLAMAVSVGSLFFFNVFAILMFIFATVKYALLLSLGGHRELLRRKIFVDIIGAFGFFVTFLGVIAGYPEESAWLFSGSFFLVSIFLFFVKPLYTFNK